MSSTRSLPSPTVLTRLLPLAQPSGLPVYLVRFPSTRFIEHPPSVTLLLRKFRFFEQQRLHVGEDEARIERAGAVDIADAAVAIDQEHSQSVVKRALRVGGVGAFIHGLAVRVEN